MEAPLVPLANAPVPPALDYAWLRDEGLARLQELSGQVWTDYNTHDPGVTLLEALCYALTDVSNRAAQPIPQLLAAPPDRPAPGADLLRPASEVFANHPVTLHDYKKLLLDELGERLKNAWITPLAGPGGEPSPPGHYQVALELAEAPAPPRSSSAPRQESVTAAALALLNAHRNLGEVFVQATVLKPRSLAVGGHLDLLPGYQPVAVLAEVLWTIGQELDPAIQAATVTQLLRADVAVEDIFAGPRAHRRILLESSFAPRLRHLHVTQLWQSGNAVAGVRALSNLQFQAGSPADQANGIVQLAGDETPVLDALASLRQLVVSQHGVPVQVEAGQVLRAYAQRLHESQRSSQARYRPEQLRLPNPAAPFPAELGRYDSVQHLLPAFYGTGEDGPPLGAAPAHRAQIMQLKGYLLLFEQLLADFCAQVAHVGEFFTTAPPALPHRGLLYAVPYVAPLLPDTTVSPLEAWHHNPAADARWQRYQADDANAYRQALARLAAGSAKAEARRGVFLTHLLARFGYTVQLYHDRSLPADEAAALQAQQRLLRQLDTATYYRAAARLPRPAAGSPGTWAESGLECWLYLLAGLESLPRKWARRQHLPDVEDQVQLGDYHSLTGTPRLLVRGRQLHFARLLDVVTATLSGAGAELRAHSPVAVRLTPDPQQPADEWEVELVNEPVIPGPKGATTVSSRVLAYLSQLDQAAERLSLLDHLVLKPLEMLGSPTPPAGTSAADWDFYHCQVTVLLPGYAARFKSDPTSGAPAGGRAFVEDLIRHHAPAHLLLNIWWLDYPTMREWEQVYAALAEASGFLNPSGESQPATLAIAQQRARQFLADYLRPAA